MYAPRKKRVQFRLRLLDADAGLKSQNYVITALFAPLYSKVIGRQRPKACLSGWEPHHLPCLSEREIESRRHHSHNNVNTFRRSNRLPDDSRIGSESPPPQVIAQNDRTVAARLA